MWLTGLVICFGWIFSLGLHEFAHALVAYWGEDKTVKDKGYLTFNLFKYTQPGLSIILPLVFILIGGMGLPGGAVYINRSLLKSLVWYSFVSVACCYSLQQKSAEAIAALQKAIAIEPKKLLN